MSSEHTTIAKRQDDGSLVEVMPDGMTMPLADRTDWQRLRDMTDEELMSAAARKARELGIGGPRLVEDHN